ncbi:hypothetical protein PGB90_005737 [Kerria lacca]
MTVINFKPESEDASENMDKCGLELDGTVGSQQESEQLLGRVLAVDDELIEGKRSGKAYRTVNFRMRSLIQERWPSEYNRANSIEGRLVSGARAKAKNQNYYTLISPL